MNVVWNKKFTSKKAKSKDNDSDILAGTVIPYDDTTKKYRGRVEEKQFFGTPNAVDSFGYYLNSAGHWVVFITDSQKGNAIARILYNTEWDAVNSLIGLTYKLKGICSTPNKMRI